MLTLTGSLRMGAFTIFRDVVFEAGQRSYTSAYYALPDAPRIATDGDGGPAIRFLWYRSLDKAPGGAAEARAGGMLTLTVELAPTQGERAALERGIPAAFGLEPGAEVRLLSLPFSSGDVALSFAGDLDGELAGKIGGNGPARLLGSERATFAVVLTKDGAAILASAIERGLDVLHLRYDLVFEHRLDGVKLRVWCDARKAGDFAAGRIASGPLTPSALREGLVARRTAGVEITAEDGVPAEQLAALEALGRRLLDEALASALFDFTAAPAGGAAHDLVRGDETGRLRPYQASFEASLNHTFTESYPAEAHAVADALLRVVLTPEQREARLLYLDVTGALEPLVVTALCPVDFAGGLVTAVHLWIAYDAALPDGTRIERRDDHVFKEGSNERVFRFDGAAEERHYRHRATVHYRDGSTCELDERTADSTLLLVDARGLGVLDVEVTLGDVRSDVVRAVVVSLEYPPRGLERQVIVDGSTPVARVQAVVGDRELAPYRWKATWQTHDGRRVEQDARTGASRRLVLDAPPGLGVTASVQAIATGNLDGVAQIVLELRTEPGAEPAQLTFTRAGESRTWAPRLEPGAALFYQARSTLVYADGIVRRLDWTDEDGPVLVVSDLLRRDVQVIPRLLDLGPSGAFALAIVALEYEDPAIPGFQRESLVLREREAEASWTFRLGAPERRRYRYQLTLVPREGARRVVPWQEAESEVLVLLPPGPEA